MTTADWLRRAAGAWDEADAIQDGKARHTKVTLAEEYERLAKHAAYLTHYGTYACRMTGEDRIDILIERNRHLLEQAEIARQKTQQLKGEHHLIALRVLETRPLADSNRSYRRIARGEQDPLVLVRRTIDLAGGAFSGVREASRVRRRRRGLQFPQAVLRKGQ
jgi:hypothetical protein